MQSDNAKMMPPPVGCYWRVTLGRDTMRVDLVDSEFGGVVQSLEEERICLLRQQACNLAAGIMRLLEDAETLSAAIGAEVLPHV